MTATSYHRQADLPHRRTREGHRHCEIRRRVQCAGPRPRRRRLLRDRQRPHHAHRYRRCARGRGRARRVHATSIGPSSPRRTEKYRTRSRHPARRSGRSMTTRSCSTGSRWRWSSPRARDRALRGFAGPDRIRARGARHRLRSATAYSRAERSIEARRHRARRRRGRRSSRRPCGSRPNIACRSSITIRWSHTPRPWCGKATAGSPSIDKTQGVQNCQNYVASVFGMPPRSVRVLSPYVGGAFGSGLRPQYQLPLAVLAARALKRSVRVALTRQQMFTLGYRAANDPDAGARGQHRRQPRRDPARCGHDDLAVRGFPADTRQLVEPALSMRQQRARPQARQARSRTRRATCARRAEPTASMRSNARWTSSPMRAKHRSARAAAEELFRDGPDRGSALQQQGAARMLPPGRGGVRLVQARPASRGRCATAANWSAGAWRPASGKRCRCKTSARAVLTANGQRRDRERHRRYRHRHLHDHGADRRRHAGLPLDSVTRQARRFRVCRMRRSKADRGRPPRSAAPFTRPADAVRRSCSGWHRRCRIRRLQARRSIDVCCSRRQDPAQARPGRDGLASPTPCGPARSTGSREGSHRRRPIRRYTRA